MAQLIVMYEPRMAPAPVADRSGDHRHGDVIEIVPDYAVTEHYHRTNPFVVLSVPGERADWDYLLEPLCEQVASDPDAGPRRLLRKRYGLDFARLPGQPAAQIMAAGRAALSTGMLESIIDSRSAE